MAGAVDIFGGRLNVPSSKSAEEWGREPVGVRERAFWSAKVAHARHVADLKAACLDSLEGARRRVRDLHMHRWTPEELEVEVDPATGKERPGSGVRRGDLTILVTREAIVGEMRKRAQERGLTPTGPRPLEDIAHESRLRLIGQMAEDTSRERARFERGNHPAILFEYPAQELIREEAREVPRDWATRWRAAADSVGWEGVARSGEWIARKDSPVWVALSAFGQPFPPFDYNSGMGVMDVDRGRAVELGLVEEDEEIANPGDVFRETCSASVQGMDDTEREWLKRTIEEAQGGEVTFTPDGRVEWTPPAPTPPPPEPPDPGPSPVDTVRLKQTQARLVEQLRAKQAQMEADARAKAAAAREAERKRREAEAKRKAAAEALRLERERRKAEREAREKAEAEARRARMEETRRQSRETLARRGVDQLRRQMDAESIPPALQSRIQAAYTPEVAQRARPPEIHVDRAIPKSYLTADGKKIFIGADVRRPEDLDGVLADLAGKLEAGRRFDVQRRLQWRKERNMIGALPIRGPHTWQQDARAVNPDFFQSEAHQKNCPRCAIAYIARTRGMDVKAKPQPVKNGQAVMDELNSDPAAPFGRVSGRFFSGGGNSTKKAIEEAMMEHGDGAQALVRVVWKNGESHVFVAEQHGGETRFIDPQLGIDAGRHFPKIESAVVYRVDNLPFSELLSRCCQS